MDPAIPADGSVQFQGHRDASELLQSCRISGGYSLGGRENWLALPELPNSDPKEKLLAVGLGIAC